MVQKGRRDRDARSVGIKRLLGPRIEDRETADGQQRERSYDKDSQEEPQAAESLALLTARELQVLRHFKELLNPKKVASRLGTRPQTVGNQLTSIEHKLGVGREELIAFIATHDI